MPKIHFKGATKKKEQSPVPIIIFLGRNKVKDNLNIICIFKNSFFRNNVPLMIHKVVRRTIGPLHFFLFYDFKLRGIGNNYSH